MKIGILTFHRACNCGAALFCSAFLPLACAAADVVVEPTAVDNAAYCAFLNACAREGDPYALWNPLMQDHFWGGIERQAASPTSFVYRVKRGYARKPATCVTWKSAARYCNWLSYGRPQTGRSTLGTTEGSATCGVYDTRDFESPLFTRCSEQVRRQSGRAYFLPTADEWRRAAFVGGDHGLVNVYDGRWAVPFPHLLDVDQGVTNRLGLVNMLGNVGEWVETRHSGGCLFAALGGSLIRGRYSVAPGYKEGDYGDKAITSFGFRVAHAPQPVALACAATDVTPVVASVVAPSPDTNLWVRIGHEGNARDPLYRVGRVDVTFEMARFPVTNADWCRFLNAVGRDRAVALGLYNPDMTTGACGGIDCMADAAFAPKPGYANRPVVYVGYRDAMRYCNWLSSGDTEKGAYDVSRPNAHRLPGARYFIPSDDEWCKAAYFDPTRDGVRKYWDYPCRTDDLPANDPRLPHACNYLREGVHLGAGAPYYLAEVTDYPTSDSFFGCRQMGGNVWEWVEPTDADNLNLRGGAFGYTEFGLWIWNRDNAGFADELNVFGLRLARAVADPRHATPSVPARIHDFVQDLPLARLALLLAALAGAGFLVGALAGAFVSRHWTKRVHV